MSGIPWAGIGQALSGAAAVGGLFAGGGGEGPDRDFWGRYWRDWERQERWRNTAIQTRVADAKAAGIHPLFALGYQGNMPGASVQPDFLPDVAADWYDRVGTLGDTLTRIGGARTKRKGDKLARELTRAQISRVKAETEAIKARSQGVLDVQPGNTGAKPDLYIRVRDNLTGRDIWLPNPDLGVEMPETVGAGYWLKGKSRDEVLEAERDRARRMKDVRGWKWDSGPCKGLTAEQAARKGLNCRRK